MTAHSANHFAQLWALGYERLVPIVPPNAPLSEKSSLHRRLHAKNPEDPRGKTPGIRWSDGSWSGFDWINHETTEHDIARWAAMGAGAGIRTGDGLVFIDADTLNEDRARIIRDTIERTFGELPPVRIGNYPKAGYLVRTDPSYRYTRIEFGERNDKGLLKDRVEILAEGRQFVAAGVHPKTRKPYRWPQGIPALETVPFVTAERLDALLEKLRPLLPAASPLVREGAATDVDQKTLKGDPQLIREAVEATPNTSDLFPTREAYRDYGYAIKAAVDDEDEAFDIWADWCAKWEDGSNDPDVVRADWSRMKPPYRRGASWIFELAAKHSGGKVTGAEQWFDTPEDTPLFPDFSPKPFDGNTEKPAYSISATPYTHPDPASLPKREFLYGHHYVRKYVSATVAPSGVGKTALSVAEALAMASGKPLLEVKPKGPLRVWLWNGEDPIEEMNLRIAAAMMHYGLTREDVGDRLLVDTGREQEIIMAADTRDGARIAAPVAAAIHGEIEAKRIDVMIVDPFVSSHRVSENDNGAIDMVTKQWAKIAGVSNCAIELVHHVRKLNGADVTVEDSRGAVALLATARSKRALAKMSAQEAKALGLLDFRQRLFRVGDERSNLALPADDETAWFELASVGVGNGAGETAAERLLTGDNVGVVTVRRTGSPVQALPDDAKGRALDILRSGEWRKDPRAGDAWAGVAIAQAMRLDLDNPSDKAVARSVLGEWIKAGDVVEVTRNDAQRRPRSYVVPAENREDGTDNVSENMASHVFD